LSKYFHSIGVILSVEGIIGSQRKKKGSGLNNQQNLGMEDEGPAHSFVKRPEREF
jgi:hypothetical protein